MIIGADPFYSGRAQQLAVLAARHALPMISAVRELLAAGGLISYGNSVTDAYRRVGALTGRILKGAKPADTPIDRATKFELVINLGTAKALGLTIPATLLARADVVIEESCSLLRSISISVPSRAFSIQRTRGRRGDRV